ncbi:hypothetical protein AGMMS50276_03000 [Synergistales bacterium]|nr:hypothetical protein AGMMS50276_03000 [Synergistales bacterium]
MIRLNITVEGQTEEEFVKQLLCPHLGAMGIFTSVRCVLTSEDKKNSTEYRGGFRQTEKAYCIVRQDILNWMKEDNNPECRFSTMFDLYALPKSFPEPEISSSDPYLRVAALEAAFKKNIDSSFHRPERFIPYIQLHEFETFIFADPQALDWEYLEHDKAISELMTIREKEENPEMINDGPETSPSKRILKQIPEYSKIDRGVNVVKKIGLDKLRQECCHFDQWLKTLEELHI